MGMDRPAPAARSSKVPATSGKFDPLIGRGSPIKVEIGRLTQPKGGGGDFKCVLIILSGLKEVPDHQLPKYLLHIQ